MKEVKIISDSTCKKNNFFVSKRNLIPLKFIINSLNIPRIWVILLSQTNTDMLSLKNKLNLKLNEIETANHPQTLILIVL